MGAFAAGAFAARVADMVVEVAMVAGKTLRNVLSEKIRNREAEELYTGPGLKSGVVIPVGYFTFLNIWEMSTHKIVI